MVRNPNYEPLATEFLCSRKRCPSCDGAKFTVRGTVFDMPRPGSATYTESVYKYRCRGCKREVYFMFADNDWSKWMVLGDSPNPKQYCRLNMTLYRQAAHVAAELQSCQRRSGTHPLYTMKMVAYGEAKRDVPNLVPTRHAMFLRWRSAGSSIFSED